MKKFFTKVSEKKKGIEKSLIILIILLIGVGVYFYNKSNYVTVRFDELGPITKNMSAYYNGFKIGKIVHIKPDKDFKHILVKVSFTQPDIHLPQNMVVYVERFPNGDLYLQFVYPKSPSLYTIKRGDILEGIAPSNLEQFMMGQSVSGMTDFVSLNIIKALNSADATNQEMKMFFTVTSKLLKKNDKSITASVDNTAAMTKNLAQAAKNLNETSRKLNSAIDSNILKGATKDVKGTTANIKDASVNIKDATSNIKDTTASISNATKDIDKTMKKIDDTVSQVNATAENLNSITTGFNETLSKRFGGMRMVFGTPVGKQHKQRNACK